MPPCTVRFLAFSGPSNLRALVLAIQATRLNHVMEAIKDLALSRTQNLQTRMPVHNHWATAISILHPTHACNAMALVVRPARCPSLARLLSAA
jgi:hypothetical protein